MHWMYAHKGSNSSCQNETELICWTQCGLTLNKIYFSVRHVERSQQSRQNQFSHCKVTVTLTFDPKYERPSTDHSRFAMKLKIKRPSFSWKEGHDVCGVLYPRLVVPKQLIANGSCAVKFFIRQLFDIQGDCDLDLWPIDVKIIRPMCQIIALKSFWHTMSLWLWHFKNEKVSCTPNEQCIIEEQSKMHLINRDKKQHWNGFCLQAECVVIFKTKPKRIIGQSSAELLIKQSGMDHV